MDVGPVLDRVSSINNVADWLTRDELLGRVRDIFNFVRIDELQLSDCGIGDLLSGKDWVLDLLSASA